MERKYKFHININITTPFLNIKSKFYIKYYKKILISVVLNDMFKTVYFFIIILLKYKF